MKEHHIEVTRTARYFTLGSMPDAGRPPLDQVWFVCHGYRQLASRFLPRFRGLDDGSRLVVAPEGFSRFYVDPSPGRHGPEHRVGASWMTREDREVEIRDYVRYLDRLAESILDGDRDVERILLGFSQGVHTASRWAVLGAMTPARLILWGAYLPPDLDMEQAAKRLAGVELILVFGQADPTVDAALHARQEERLRAAGIEYRSVVHGGGHQVDRELIVEIAEGRA